MKKLIKKREVLILCGISTSTLYRLMQNNQFPLNVKTGLRSVAWVEEEVLDWIEKCISERDSLNSL